MSFHEIDLDFEVKIYRYPTTAYNRIPGTGKSGYSSYNSQKPDVVVIFYCGQKEIKEDVRDRILNSFEPKRKNVTQRLENTITLTKPKKIKIDTDEDGNYIRINEEWLDGWISAIKAELNKKM